VLQEQDPAPVVPRPPLCPGDVVAVGATAAYYRSIGNHLTATAAIGTESVNRELLDDIWTAQAMLGLRYSF